MLTSPAMLNAQFVYVANAGDNTVSAYRMGTFGDLTAIGSFPTENRPHSVAVDPMNRFVYVVNADSNSVSAYRIEPTGALRLISSTFAEGFPLSVAVDPTGRFVYVTGFTPFIDGSQDGSVTAFSIGPTGALTRISFYRAHRILFAVVVDPTGRFVYAAGRFGVSAFRIEATGRLTPIELLTLNSNLSRVAVDPAGQFAYISLSVNPPREPVRWWIGGLPHRGHGSADADRRG